VLPFFPKDNVLQILEWKKNVRVWNHRWEVQQQQPKKQRVRKESLCWSFCSKKGRLSYFPETETVLSFIYRVRVGVGVYNFQSCCFIERCNRGEEITFLFLKLIKRSLDNRYFQNLWDISFAFFKNLSFVFTYSIIFQKDFFFSISSPSSQSFQNLFPISAFSKYFQHLKIFKRLERIATETKYLLKVKNSPFYFFQIFTKNSKLNHKRGSFGN